MLKTMDNFIFARLGFIFTCTVAEKDYAICLAQPLDSPTGQQRSKDKELRLHRLREKSSMEFFFVGSIVRGAPIVQDFAKPGDYFVVASANREVFVGIPECPRNARFGKSIQLATLAEPHLHSFLQMGCRRPHR